MATMMRAARYVQHGGPEVISVDQIPVPEPAKGQVLVEMVAASVAPLDWKMRAGLLQQHFTLSFPKTPGRDGAGRVVACGPGISRLAPGDRVAVMAPPAGQAGTHAEFVLADADLVVPLPDELDFDAAAALVNAGLSAWIAVMRTAQVRSGQRVLVQSGAGAVGGLIVQMCAHLGAEVTATCRAANADYVRGLGAAHVIAYDGPASADVPPQDVVFDLMGGAVHDACYAMLTPGGHLVWLTAATITDRSTEFGVRVTRAMITDDADVVSEVMSLAARGVLRAQIADILPLDQAAEAQRRLAAGEVTRGRLILRT
ncbi:NADPH:quinone reductase [Gemmobacter megaterium]|uniref:NADPH:quinone reductase n=1 Tax=Gemmobacter megaterium TaxID=1086013 RepID=A0A1N7Q482_9RHOB|nr:NADP-dependent oxidoreductase [Gemmobacter megaterium]GGE22890.1 oxidoreductase [Gemmobacter megaterium]SIT17700.1 NADPH:quinone reductase [Gemmobacter megaterium]